VLQCVAVCCSVLQCVAVCCSVMRSSDIYTLAISEKMVFFEKKNNWNGECALRNTKCTCTHTHAHMLMSVLCRNTIHLHTYIHTFIYTYAYVHIHVYINGRIANGGSGRNGVGRKGMVGHGGDEGGAGSGAGRQEVVQGEEGGWEDCNSLIVSVSSFATMRELDCLEVEEERLQEGVGKVVGVMQEALDEVATLRARVRELTGQTSQQSAVL